MEHNSHRKVVIVGPAFPLRGGIANFNEALALAMQKKGFDVSVSSFYYQYPSFLFPGKTQLDTTGVAPEGLTINDSISSINPISWRKTAQQIIDQQPDYVVFRFWLPFMGPALGGIAKRLRKKGIKVLAITDNVIPHESKPGDRSLTKYFLTKCDGFITLSASVLDDISTFTSNPNKIMLPHPVYDTFGDKVSRAAGISHLKLDSKVNYILFFGLIRGYKGLDLALKALQNEKIKSGNIKLIIAGEFYDKKEKYTAIIEELNLQDQIILHDFYIPSEDVKYYFAAADCVVQPYKTATQSGITQIAYHFDKPMIVTNVGGLPEIVPHEKVGFVTECNATGIAEAIVRFYAEDVKSRFEINIVEEKKKYQWDYFVEQLDQFALGIK
jgi:D-inositol-3-phosphate glycosyltransferase